MKEKHYLKFLNLAKMQIEREKNRKLVKSTFKEIESDYYKKLLERIG